MIRQFDIVPNPFPAGRGERPFLVAVQHNRLSELSTRVLVPLVATGKLGLKSRLNPEIVLEGRTYFIDPTNMVTLPLRLLGKPVANIESSRDRIIAALDLVFTGI